MAEAGSLRQATSKRHAHIVSLVETGVGQVEEIAKVLGVSPSTVRRDFAHLMRGGRLMRTYGGAILRGGFHERSIDDSAAIRFQAKTAIATAAANFISDGQTVFIDAGTTCAAMANRLHDRRDLTVMTRGLETAHALISVPGVTVMMMGGTLLKLSHGIVGPLTTLTLQRMQFDLAFLGADAVDPKHGIGEPTLEETVVKEQVAAVSSEVFVLADSTKISGGRPPAWTALEPGWRLITDSDVSTGVHNGFAKADVEVIVAPY